MSWPGGRRRGWGVGSAEVWAGRREAAQPWPPPGPASRRSRPARPPFRARKRQRPPPRRGAIHHGGALREVDGLFDCHAAAGVDVHHRVVALSALLGQRAQQALLPQVRRPRRHARQRRQGQHQRRREARARVDRAVEQQRGGDGGDERERRRAVPAEGAATCAAPARARGAAAPGRPLFHCHWGSAFTGACLKLGLRAGHRRSGTAGEGRKDHNPTPTFTKSALVSVLNNRRRPHITQQADQPGHRTANAMPIGGKLVLKGARQSLRCHVCAAGASQAAAGACGVRVRHAARPAAAQLQHLRSGNVSCLASQQHLYPSNSRVAGPGLHRPQARPPRQQRHHAVAGPADALLATPPPHFLPRATLPQVASRWAA
jgi:hypothetical protein